LAVLLSKDGLDVLLALLLSTALPNVCVDLRASFRLGITLSNGYSRIQLVEKMMKGRLGSLDVMSRVPHIFFLILIHIAVARDRMCPVGTEIDAHGVE
jgi:hypothetical protein